MRIIGRSHSAYRVSNVQLWAINNGSNLIFIFSCFLFFENSRVSLLIGPLLMRYCVTYNVVDSSGANRSSKLQ
jgi:hypothetical protein